MSLRRTEGAPIRFPGGPLLLVPILWVLGGCAERDMQDLRDYVARTKASSPGRKLEDPPEVTPYVPFFYTAQGLTDPFRPAAFVEPEPVAVDTGVRPDPDRPREELEQYALGSLKMVGMIERDGLWALVKAPDGIVHRVAVGNYLGTDHGRVVAIAEDRIEVAEIVADAASGGWIERDNFLSLAE